MGNKASSYQTIRRAESYEGWEVRTWLCMYPSPIMLHWICLLLLSQQVQSQSWREGCENQEGDPDTYRVLGVIAHQTMLNWLGTGPLVSQIMSPQAVLLSGQRGGLSPPANRQLHLGMQSPSHLEIKDQNPGSPGVCPGGRGEGSTPCWERNPS